MVHQMLQQLGQLLIGRGVGELMHAGPHCDEGISWGGDPAQPGAEQAPEGAP